MSTSEIIKKVKKLTSEVEEASSYNKRVLDEHQIIMSQLNQYVREEEERLRNLKENFMLEVQVLRQEMVKLNNEYRQEVSFLRNDWIKTFAFS